MTDTKIAKWDGKERRNLKPKPKQFGAPERASERYQNRNPEPAHPEAHCRILVTRPDDEHGPRIRFEFHDWAFVCIGSTVTTLRPDFRAPVARRVVGLRSQFRVEALVWPLSEGIRTRHCHLRHRVSPTEPGDRCESASLDIQTGGATMWDCPSSLHHSFCGACSHCLCANLDQNLLQ